MKKIVLFMLMFIAIYTVKAQDYSTGIGLRGGFFSGVSIKHFIGANKAVEGILDTRWKGFNITGLYEIHSQAFDIDRLNWYYGVGGHVGFWNGSDVNWGDDSDYTLIGVDGILGIEYNFHEIPINIGLDWKPTINLSGHSGFWGDGGALTIRYIF